jgi:hypothetical protein
MQRGPWRGRDMRGEEGPPQPSTTRRGVVKFVDVSERYGKLTLDDSFEAGYERGTTSCGCFFFGDGVLFVCFFAERLAYSDAGRRLGSHLIKCMCLI